MLRGQSGRFCVWRARQCRQSAFRSDEARQIIDLKWPIVSGFLLLPGVKFPAPNLNIVSDGQVILAIAASDGDLSHRSVSPTQFGYLSSLHFYSSLSPASASAW